MTHVLAVAVKNSRIATDVECDKNMKGDVFKHRLFYYICAQ